MGFWRKGLKLPKETYRKQLSHEPVKMVRERALEYALPAGMEDQIRKIRGSAKELRKMAEMLDGMASEIEKGPSRGRIINFVRRCLRKDMFILSKTK